MASPVPFEGCWQRIERAQTHRKSFIEIWDKFLDEEPYAIYSRVDPGGTGAIWIEPRYSSLPTVFALELGEILYQLRAALDGIVYEAAILDSGQNPPPNEKSLAFPVCNSITDFNNCAQNIKPLAQERKAIIESVQPYNAPKLTSEKMVNNIHRSLGILHDWARKDRHRKLHVVGSWMSKVNPKIRIIPPTTGPVHITVNRSGFLEHDGEIATFKIRDFQRGMKVQANPNLFLDIAIDEIPRPCCDADTLGERIDAMINAVQAVLGSIQNSF